MSIIQLERERLIDTAATYLGEDHRHHISNLVVQPKDGVPLAPHAQRLFLTIVPRIDRDLARIASEPDSFVRPVHDGESDHVPVFVETMATVFRQHPDTTVVSLLWGAVPQHVGLREKLHAMELYTDGRVEVLRIFGTVGTHTGQAGIEDEIPHDLLRAPYVILHDDVVDSANHAALFIARRLEVLGKTDGSAIEAILKRLGERKFTTPFIVDKEIYEGLALEARRAGVVLAVPFWKNKTLFNALKNLSEQAQLETEQYRWASLQREFLKRGKTFGQSEWLMGEGLDTCMDGADLIEHINEVLSAYDHGTYDPKDIDAFFGLLSTVKLRIGTFVPGLVALDETRRQEFFDWVGERLLEYGVRYTDAQYHPNDTE